MNCPLQKRRCGGCSRLSVPYEKQARVKQDKVRALFGKSRAILSMEDPTRYRNKVISAFAWDRSGLISGMYAFGTHFVLPTDDCLLENQRADEIVCAARKALADLNVKAFDENKKTGLIRFVQVRRAMNTGEALVTLVFYQDTEKIARAAAEKIMAACPDVRGVVLNVNDREGSAVLGFREKILAGEGTIRDTICGLSVLISSRSFYQVNTAQAERLYASAVQMAELGKNDFVIDAYCGIGIIGLLAAKRAKRVLGVELNGEAVRLAKENAKLNDAENIEFLQGDVEKVLKTRPEKPDAVFLDPPRAGCGEAFLAALCALAPQKIVYISCDVTTQRRDADFLEKNGYAIRRVQPVDMFPHTDHIENVVLLSKLDPDTHVSVVPNISELDTTASENKATYGIYHG